MTKNTLKTMPCPFQSWLGNGLKPCNHKGNSHEYCQYAGKEWNCPYFLAHIHRCNEILKNKQKDDSSPVSVENKAIPQEVTG